MNGRSEQNGAPGPWLIAMTVMLSVFMEVLDTSVANVALPHIAGNLSASVEESTWVLTSYLVSNAIVLPLTGWFSTVFGRKHFYMVCVALFTATSLLCGLAPSLGWLVVFRVLQGAGGGAMVPISQAILMESFPRSKRGMAMAVFGMGVIVAPIIGPTLGGWITDNYTWRWIFFINIPVGVVSLLLTSLLLSDPPYLIRKSLRGLRIDYIGLGLLSVGLGFLQVVLDKGQLEDWFGSNFIIGCSVVAVIGLVGALIWELRDPDPVVDLRMLKDRNLFLGTLTMFMLGFVLYGSTVLLPILLQTLLGYTAVLSGLVLSPGGLVVLFMMPLVGLLISRFEARWLAIFGLSVTAFSLFQMAHFNLQLDFRTAVLTRMIQGVGMAFLFVPINTAAFAFIAKERMNYATGLINLARNIGGSCGIASVATMLARRNQFHQVVLASHLTALDYPVQAMLHGTSRLLHAAGSGHAQAAAQAYGLLYGGLLRQASMLSFGDNFWLMGVICLVMVPVMFLTKQSRPGESAVPSH